MLHEKTRPSWPILTLVVVAVLTVIGGVAYAGNGPGGPGGGGKPNDPGPTPSISDTGSLFGDLYVLLRYLGGETKPDGSVAVGGEPVLTQEPGWQVIEIGEEGDEIVYDVRLAQEPDGTPIASECLQPVADYARWGDIWPTDDEGRVLHQVGEDTDSDGAYDTYEWVPITGPSDYETSLDRNRLPLVLTYTVSGPEDDAWTSTEAEIGLLLSTPVVDQTDGSLILDVDPYFIQPGGTWTDPNNAGPVTYEDGVLWTDLVQEVSFGRISVSRSPEAVLQSAFDEAINAINSDDTVALEIDPAGRLLLTKNVYDEYLVDASGDPLYLGTTTKAIDSPLENLALYVKLMKDGHLVTPGIEREPIDRSPTGGIPIWKEIQMEDGPSTALRPTIDIDKMRDWGFDELVSVDEVDYYAYYTEVSTTTTTHKGKPNQDPVDVPVYVVVPAGDEPPADMPEGTPISTGILEDDGGSPDDVDLAFAASFLAAAADKVSDIGVDMVVYLNSILGINLVTGEYADDPAYFDYSAVTGYGRASTFAARGEQVTLGGGGSASTYDGHALVLQGATPTWTETSVPLVGGPIVFDSLGQDPDTHFPNGQPGAVDILGFAQMADDDLSVIEFIHTYQIPGRR